MDKKYKRPDTTFQDTLSKDTIKEYLEDYVFIEKNDLKNIPLNTHVRYYIEKDGKQLFRLGGFVVNNLHSEKFIMLSNGNQTWSVDTNLSTIYRKITFDELKERYNKKINKLKEKIKIQEKIIDQYRS